jgi:hypothetical protein
MRRGVKPFLALGAVAAVPLVVSVATREDSAAFEAGDREFESRPLGWLADVAAKFLHAVAPTEHGGKYTDAETSSTQARAHWGGPSAAPLGGAAAPRTTARFHRTHNVSPVELAQEHPADVASLRQQAGATFGGPLPERFSDAELMRFAVHHGFLCAQSPAERERALGHAAAAAAETAVWLLHHTFASDAELQKYEHLVWWDRADGAGRPTLHVALGRAVHECRGPEAAALANVVITHVERAVRALLRDGPPASLGQVDVVVDARGATSLGASRVAWVLKAVAAALSSHYPGRLHELELRDLPLMLSWLAPGVKRLVHPDTARKVRTTHSPRGATAAE